MGSERSVLQQDRDNAIAELSAFFSGRPGSRQLQPSELQAIRSDAVAGWAISISVPGRPIPVTIVVDQRFPFSRPRIILNDKALFLKIPHVDASGLLCVVPDHATSSPTRVRELAEVLLTDAELLLTEGFSGGNRQDFVNEFYNYWISAIESPRATFVSLLRPEAPSRLVTASLIGSFTLFAETPEEAVKWLNNLNPAVSHTSAVPSLLIWLSEPVYPEDYPRTNRGVLALARKALVQDLLYDLIPEGRECLRVIFGFSTSNGPVLGGVILNPPDGKSLQKGFRPGHIPRNVLITRYLSGTKADMVIVRRADPTWICFRGGENLSKTLIPKTVVIIGCGSLGADIAYLIAKAGVGRLVLIDDDLLSWDNIGRHLLGANSVGQLKAKALQKFLRAQLPHLSATAYSNERWEAVYETKTTIIASSDLVIATTGDWASEAALNVVVRSNLKFPPTLFGWIEPFGCAGHALLVKDIGGCLGCGMDEFGHFTPSVCAWEETKTSTRSPGCGDFFQPYGSIRISPIKSMIAEMAIDALLGNTTRSELRSWVGSFKYLKDHGGNWSKEWTERYGDPKEGELRVSKSWPIASTCPLCH